jgi:hypothetical protein
VFSRGNYISGTVSLGSGLSVSGGGFGTALAAPSGAAAMAFPFVDERYTRGGRPQRK